MRYRLRQPAHGVQLRQFLPQPGRQVFLPLGTLVAAFQIRQGFLHLVGDGMSP